MSLRRGHTLVELLVAIALASVVVGVVCGVWVSSLRQGYARRSEEDSLLVDWQNERGCWKLKGDHGKVRPALDSALFETHGHSACVMP